MNHERYKQRKAERRKFRVRKRIRGTAERPRLSIFRSVKHIYAQIIDDESGSTLASASTMDKQLHSEVKYSGNVEAAKAVGKLIAERATAKGVQQVAFDRGPNRYHGRVASLADSAREAGLQF